LTSFKFNQVDQLIDPDPGVFPGVRKKYQARRIQISKDIIVLLSVNEVKAPPQDG